MITFNKHMHQELSFFINKLKNHEHFALSRYGDGEIHVVKNNQFSCSQWQFNGDISFRKALTESLRYQHDDFFFGIPCGCIEAKNNFRQYLFNSFPLDHSRLTFASIFTNSMHSRTQKEFIPLFKEYPIILTANQTAKPSLLTQQGYHINQYFPIDNNAWKTHNKFVDEILDYAEKTQPKNTLFLFSAGPLSNIAIHKLHQHHPDNTYIDIGSAFDPCLSISDPDRTYQNPLSWKRLANCYWHHPEDPHNISCSSADKSKLYRLFLRLKSALSTV